MPLNIFFSFLFFISQIAIGLAVVSFFDKENRFYLFEKILSAIILGGVFSGFFVLLLALLLKSLLSAIFIFIILALVMFLLLTKPLLRRPKISFHKLNIFSLKNAWLIVLLSILALYWILIRGLLFETSGGTLKTALNAWGDTAVHISIIQRMATAQPFIIDNPIMGNAHLTYSFLIDFLSAIFLKLGMNMVFAFRFPLLIYGTCALLFLFAIARRILKSKPFAILALFLIICGSGFGFFTFFSDLKIEYQNHTLQDIVKFFQNPPHQYTSLHSNGDNIVWIAPSISLLSHQRSFPLGLAIFSFILLGALVYGKSPYFWRFGIIAGLLPLAHIHSFLSLFFLMAVLFWFNLKQWKIWLKFGFFTAVIALPQILYFKSGNNISALNFIKLWFGWMVCEHSSSWFACPPSMGTYYNVFAFWIKNFGIVFLLWIAIIMITIFFLILKKQKIKTDINLNIPLAVASLMLFALPNFFLFQPWNFDNNKILFYWWIIAILFCVTPFLMWLWNEKLIGKILVIILVFFAVIAGSVDFTARIIATEELYFGYSDSNKDKFAMGQWIKANTPANSLFLTSSWVDPAPLFLSGRPIYLGYEGWLWTWGLDASANKKNIEKILNGNLDLACEEKIDYILDDYDLRNRYPSMKESRILLQGTIVFSQGIPPGRNYIIKTPCQND